MYESSVGSGEEGGVSTNSANINIYGKHYAVNFSLIFLQSPMGDWRNIRRLANDEDLEGFDGKYLKGIAGIQVER